MKNPVLVALTVVLAAWLTMQRSPAQAAPGNAPRAKLTYTATNMRQGLAGRAIGKSSLTLAATPSFCDGDERESVAHIQKVSAQKPESTIDIPAERPLILQSFWSASDRHCLIGNLAFRAEPGAAYRMTTDVDLATDSCRVIVEQRKSDGDYRLLGQLQTLEQICN